MSSEKSGAPVVRESAQRYFNNPFPDYSGQTLGDQVEYIDQVLALMQDIYTYYTTNPNRRRRDIYTGGAGVAYGCMRLSQRLPEENPDRENVRNLCANIIDTILTDIKTAPNKEKSFMNGDHGVYVVAALVYAELGRTADAEKALREFQALTVGLESLALPGSSADECFSGRSGYLIGFLELWKRFPDHPTLLEVPVVAIIKAILSSGREYSNVRGFHTRSPLMFLHFEAEYIGAAHGISTILHTLLSFPSVLSDMPGALQDVKASYEYLLSSQQPSGNFASIFGQVEDEETELVQWCHGAAGVIYSLAKAYLVLNEDRYLQGCKKCADVLWRKGLMKKGPGLCHGISGSGYAFLIMYRLTDDTEYLYRANSFADIMFQPTVREFSRLPDHPYSLFEGIAGTMCYYLDITEPTKAAFPFFDIFTECPAHFSKTSSTSSSSKERPKERSTILSTSGS